MANTPYIPARGRRLYLARDDTYLTHVACPAEGCWGVQLATDAVLRGEEAYQCTRCGHTEYADLTDVMSDGTD